MPLVAQAQNENVDALTYHAKSPKEKVRTLTAMAAYYAAMYDQPRADEIKRRFNEIKPDHNFSEGVIAVDTDAEYYLTVQDPHNISVNTLVEDVPSLVEG